MSQSTRTRPQMRDQETQMSSKDKVRSCVSADTEERLQAILNELKQEKANVKHQKSRKRALKLEVGKQQRLISAYRQENAAETLAYEDLQKSKYIVDKEMKRKTKVLADVQESLDAAQKSIASLLKHI